MKSKEHKITICQLDEVTIRLSAGLRGYKKITNESVYMQLLTVAL